jgi:leucyl-tRNA synthetase
LLVLLAPFAPYLAEELWARAGGPYSVHGQAWPEDAAPAPQTPERATVELVVQVDGRVRDRLSVPAGLEAPDAVARATAAPKVARLLLGRPVLRSIYLTDRLVNLVTKADAAGANARSSV